MKSLDWTESPKRIRYIVPGLTLLILLAVTLFTWHTTRNATNQLSRNYFDFRVAEIVNRIEERLQTYEQVLFGVRGIYEFSNYIDRHRFKKYVASLRLVDNYPGFEGVGFSLLIPAAKLDAHLADIRKEGFLDYSIKPEGQRDPYSSILYLEPFSDRNLRAFGYDMFSEPIRRKAMERARDTGNAAMSGKVRLVQESGKNEQAGFLVYVPVYRKDMPHNTLTEKREHLIGWAYSPFRMNDLMGSLADQRSNELGIRIYDGQTAGEDALMFDSLGSMQRLEPKRFYSRQNIEFGGHVWTIELVALPGMDAHIDQSRPVLVAAVGLSISLLVTWLVWLLVNGREGAIRMALEMNRELIAAQSRLSSTLNAIPDLMFELGLDGRYYKIHAPRPELLVATEAALLGKRMVEVMPPEAADICMDALQEANEKGASFGHEFRLVSGKKYRWFELSIARKQGVDEQDPRFIVLSRDITRRKEIENALQLTEKRWQFALDSTGDGIWDWNVAEGSVFFSRQWKEMLGFSEEEIGTSLEEWRSRVHPDDMVHIRADIQAHWDGKAPIYSNEHRMRCKDGSWKWILDRGVLIERSEDGKPLRMIGTHQDITKQRQYIEHLSKARELAEEIAKAKASFLATMSHEIRTPMNAIIGLSRLALNKEIPAEVRDYLEKIFDASNNLMAILNNILDLSKIEAKRMTIEPAPFDLDALLENLEYMFMSIAEEKGLDLRIELDPKTPRRLIGDALRLQQVLTNFLGNAIKFTEQGRVTLRVKLLKADEKKALIHFGVEDTGIGIEKKDIYKLFQSFSQIDGSITRRFGGTGLGLFISRELLGLMGSEIQVETMPGRGAYFHFQLSLDIAPQDEQDDIEQQKQPEARGVLAAECEGSDHLKGARILVVEDDAINQLVARELLKHLGVVSTFANNGAEALEQLEKDLPDGVLMDMHMPVMDGLEATRRIRANPRLADLPIIALTAEVSTENREHLLANGMNDFIGKPFDSADLIVTLRRWIKLDRKRLAPQEGAAVDAMSPAATEQALLALPGFDFDNILKTLRGNHLQVTGLLITFANSMTGISGQIKEKIGRGAFEEAHMLVHRIKGTAGSLGAIELFQAAEHLDTQLKKDECEPETLKVFEEAFDRAMSAIASLEASKAAMKENL